MIRKEKRRELSIIEDELHRVLKREVADILEIGRLLNEAKAQLNHGEWLPWLKNFVLSERSAQRYMLAAEFAEKKSATVADLGNLSPGALYLVSAMGKDGQVLVEAILKEAAIRRVDQDRVREIANELEPDDEETGPDEAAKAEGQDEEYDPNAADAPPAEMHRQVFIDGACEASRQAEKARRQIQDDDEVDEELIAAARKAAEAWAKIVADLCAIIQRRGGTTTAKAA